MDGRIAQSLGGGSVIERDGGRGRQEAGGRGERRPGGQGGARKGPRRVGRSGRFLWMPPEADRPIIRPSQGFIVSLDTTPGAALTVSGHMVFAELF